MCQACGLSTFQKMTRVDLLLDDIECKDPGRNAAITMVKGHKKPTGNINKFEDTAAYVPCK